MKDNNLKPKTRQAPLSDPAALVSGRVPKGGDSLPCLNSNNSTENSAEALEGFNLLSPYNRKQALAMCENAKKFVSSVGLCRVGFLTLTFADNVRDHKEASRRFNSLKTHFFPLHFGCWMLVKERQTRGAWHYHLLVDCKTDIRTGVIFDEIYGRDKNQTKGRGSATPSYRSAGQELRSIWKSLREDLPNFNFGRSELLPIETTDLAVARYVGKYVSKHIGARKKEDKGVRLFSCSRDFRRAATTNFAWNTEGSQEWRRKLSKFAQITGIDSLDDMCSVFGPSWSYHLASYINQVDDRLPHELIRIKKVYSQRRQFFINEPPTMSHDGFLIHEKSGEILF